ncbi:MAG TPA: hypothetical protein VF950_17630 [Planctomycetota bacterium]
MKRFTPLHLLLALSAVLLAVGLVYSVRAFRVDWGDDPRHAEEAGRAMAEAEKASGKAQRDFLARRFQEADAQARAGLPPARALLASCETRPPGDPDVQRDLVQAALAFGRHLDLHPEDVDILLLRARAGELRRFGDKAAADLKRLMELKPDLAESLEPRLKRAQAGYP